MRQIRRINVILLVIAALLLIGPALVSYALSQQYPSVSTIGIKDMQVIGESAVCPGDELVVAYTFYATGSGVLVRDSTTWRTDPPETIVFSMARRFILTGPVEQKLLDIWKVPVTYINPELGRELPLLPGNYERLISVSSPSRSTVIAIGSAPFSIKDC